MCGVAGYFGEEQIPEKNLKTCQDLMRRRGPDATGLFKSKDNINFALLHSRLSIIDKSDKSNQPFYDDLKNVLSFNGEIYNYLEIKKKLQKTTKFKTSGDTEVLFNLIKSSGIEAVSKCEGMWAFAYYDNKKKKLFLCRDRFGEKPLFYYKSEKGIFFGSEIKFIFALLGKKLSINYDHLKRYLVNGYKSIYKVNETFFENLYEIKSGYFYEIDEKIKIHKKRYWQPTFDKYNYKLSYNEVTEKTLDLLKESVKLRLRSDVPIAFCLSGGIDSNALISISQKCFNHNVHGFSIINDDERYEELDMIEHVEKKMKIKVTKINLTKDKFLQNLKEQIIYHDSPILTITYYAQWCLMKKISDEGYKVSISGTGADEIFSGYYDHHNAYLYYIKENHYKKYKECLRNWNDQIGVNIRNPFLKDPDYFSNKENRKHIYLNRDFFLSLLRKNFDENFNEINYSKILLRNRMANEMFNESVPVILHEDDLNSMYYSVENRSPFLDSKLYDFSLTIPTEYLIQKGLAKTILRDALKNIAPQKILKNPRKVGFNVPLNSYLDFENNDTKDFLLEEGEIFQIINRDKVSKIFRNDLTNSFSKFLFNFINAKLFIENFQ